MFERLSIKNFRCITNLEIKDFKRFNLFVGKNNSGKTTILESLFLLTNPTNADLPNKINYCRQYNLPDESFYRSIFYKMNIKEKVLLSCKLKEQNEERNLVIKPFFQKITEYTPSTSQIGFREERATENDISLSKSELSGFSLEFTPKRKEIETPRKITIDTQVKFLDQERFVIKIKNPTDYKEYLNGKFLNNVTLTKKNIADSYEKIKIEKKDIKIINLLQKIEPSLTDISIFSKSRIFCDIGFDRWVPLNFLGNGIEKLLGILVAILVTKNGIVLIDEFENGLYSSSQGILWKEVFEAAEEFNVQIFATTHSLECAKAFCDTYSRLIENSDYKDKDDIRLFRIEREDDKFSSVSYDKESLEISFEKGWEFR